jgi:hypothetical protein
MPVSKKTRPKIKVDDQFKHVTWTVKDGKIEKDEYVRVNHNGKIRNKHTHRSFNPSSMKNVKGMDGKCNSLFPGRHTRRNLPKTKMLADVPELMDRLSMNVQQPKMVTFNPNITEPEFRPSPSLGPSLSPILIRQPGLLTHPQTRIPNNNQLFPISTQIDRMPVSNDIVFLDGLSLKGKPKKKRAKPRSHKKPRIKQDLRKKEK